MLPAPEPVIFTPQPHKLARFRSQAGILPSSTVACKMRLGLLAVLPAAISGGLGLAPPSSGYAQKPLAATSSFTPPRPPAIPLAVRSPYLSVWLHGESGGLLPGTWPKFWT